MSKLHHQILAHLRATDPKAAQDFEIAREGELAEERGPASKAMFSLKRTNPAAHRVLMASSDGGQLQAEREAAELAAANEKAPTPVSEVTRKAEATAMALSSWGAVKNNADAMQAARITAEKQVASNTIKNQALESAKGTEQ